MCRVAEWRTMECWAASKPSKISKKFRVTLGSKLFLKSFEFRTQRRWSRRDWRTCRSVPPLWSCGPWGCPPAPPGPPGGQKWHFWPYFNKQKLLIMIFEGISTNLTPPSRPPLSRTSSGGTAPSLKNHFWAYLKKKNFKYYFKIFWKVWHHLAGPSNKILISSV